MRCPQAAHTYSRSLAERFGIALGQDPERATLPQGRHEVLDLPLHRHGDRRLEQPLADGAHDVGGQGPRRDDARRTVGEDQGELGLQDGGGGTVDHAGTEGLGEEGHDKPLVLEVQHEADDQHESERDPEEGPAEGNGVRFGGGLRQPEDSREAQFGPKWEVTCGLLLARGMRMTRNNSRTFRS